MNQPTDPESTAAAELGRRRARTQTMISYPAVLMGVLAIFPVYILVRDLQFEYMGSHWVIVSALVGAAVAAVVIWTGRLVSRAVIRARAPSWIDELSARHGVSREDLLELEREVQRL